MSETPTPDENSDSTPPAQPEEAHSESEASEKEPTEEDLLLEEEIAIC